MSIVTRGMGRPGSPVAAWGIGIAVVTKAYFALTPSTAVAVASAVFAGADMQGSPTIAQAATVASAQYPLAEFPVAPSVAATVATLEFAPLIAPVAEMIAATEASADSLLTTLYVVPDEMVAATDLFLSFFVEEVEIEYLRDLYRANEPGTVVDKVRVPKLQRIPTVELDEIRERLPDKLPVWDNDPC